MQPPERPSSTEPDDSLAFSTPSVVGEVLARLPIADRERAADRRRQLYQRLAVLALVTLLLLACVGPQTSNVSTRGLAWLLAAAETWRALVVILLGGLALIPVLSCLCLLAVSFALWQRVIGFERRGAQ